MKAVFINEHGGTVPRPTPTGEKGVAPRDNSRWHRTPRGDWWISRPPRWGVGGW